MVSFGSPSEMMDSSHVEYGVAPELGGSVGMVGVYYQAAAAVRRFRDPQASTISSEIDRSSREPSLVSPQVTPYATAGAVRVGAAPQIGVRFSARRASSSGRCQRDSK